MSFQREYLMRLPLPLAQLYCRAHNAKDARDRHDSTIYLFEALVKLTVAPLVAAYVAGARSGGPHCDAAQELLGYLARPSTGHWLLILRQLARHFGERADAEHPLGPLWSQFDQRRSDAPGMMALYAAIKNGPDGTPSVATAVSASTLFDVLVAYRNQVMSLGGPRAESFYEKFGGLAFEACNELLDERRFSWWGGPDTRFVYVDDVRKLDARNVEVSLRELAGLHSERMAARAVAAEEAESCSPNHVGILWPDHGVPLSLDPLLIYRDVDRSEELYFWHRRGPRDQAEYLSYTTGRTLREPALGAALDSLLDLPTPSEVEQAADRAPARVPRKPPEVVIQPPAGEGASAEVLAQLLVRLDEVSTQFSAQFNELREGIRRAVRIAQDDPEMSLTRARKVLDYIVRDVYDLSMKKEKAGSQPLDSLMQRLVKEGHLPTRIAAHANTVRNWGNVGTHTFGETITSDDVLQSLNSLLPIVQWYFEQKQQGMPSGGGSTP